MFCSSAVSISWKKVFIWITIKLFTCGQISTLDEETLMDPEGDLVCPHCGATFDIELEGTEDDSAEETDKQDH